MTRCWNCSVFCRLCSLSSGLANNSGRPECHGRTDQRKSHQIIHSLDQLGILFALLFDDPAHTLEGDVDAHQPSPLSCTVIAAAVVVACVKEVMVLIATGHRLEDLRRPGCSYQGLRLWSSPGMVRLFLPQWTSPQWGCSSRRPNISRFHAVLLRQGFLAECSRV